MDEPLRLDEVRRLLRAILETGTVIYPRHARDQLRERGLTAQDCENVMRAGRAGEGELEAGTWRYRVQTARMVVVVAFRSETSAVVVTAWRQAS